MATLDAIADAQTSLLPGDVARLHALAAEWQVLADLSFSDLVMWLPETGSNAFIAAAQIRPTTGQTSLDSDIVGTLNGRTERPWIHEAFNSRSRVQASDQDSVAIDAVAVLFHDRVIAVIERLRKSARTQGRLEDVYVQTAADLLDMVGAGAFPDKGERSSITDSLRVGDGFIRLDDSGVVSFASPNAMSAFRRLGHHGDLEGAELGGLASELTAPRLRPGDVGAVRIGSRAFSHEAELETADATVILRAIPLVREAQEIGTAVILRDITDVRMREKQLITQEATIREIHHRVKNNLQTVAALLRLQSRRIDAPEAQSALAEAMQRIDSIALVHEMLSQTFHEQVEFDQIADQLLRNVIEVSRQDSTITGSRSGSFGVINADIASSLSMVVTELIQNAAQHAFGESGGHISLSVERLGEDLQIGISDDGRGMPGDVDPSLGMSIVRTLVESELGGNLEYQSSNQGTRVQIVIPAD